MACTEKESQKYCESAEYFHLLGPGYRIQRDVAFNLHVAMIDELEQTVKEYTHYYNHDRIRVKLKGLSPVQNRTQSLKAD